jgi:hypothetical protein
MSYMTQEHKKEINANLKPILKKYGVKGRLGVNHHSVLVLNLFSGKIDFMESYNRMGRILTKRRYGSDAQYQDATRDQVNIFHTDRWYDGEAKAFFAEVLPILNGANTSRENFDESDAMTDYFHVGWYVNVNVGRWDRNYEVTA